MKVEAKCPTNNNKTTNFLLTIACETCGRLYVINICDGLVVDNHEQLRRFNGWKLFRVLQ